MPYHAESPTKCQVSPITLGCSEGPLYFQCLSIIWGSSMALRGSSLGEEQCVKECTTREGRGAEGDGVYIRLM